MPKPNPDRPHLDRHNTVPHGNFAGKRELAGWLGHIEAGRIGTKPQTTPQQFLRHLRNEEVLLGRPRTLKFATPEAYKERR